MRFRLLIVVLLVLSYCVPAHADDLETFVFNGVFQSGASATGTFQLDLSTGWIDAGKANYGSGDPTLYCEYCPQPGSLFGLIYILLSAGGNAPWDFEQMVIAAPTTTLVGYQGGELCSVTFACTDPEFSMSEYQVFDLNPPTLDPIITTDKLEFGTLALAATPEPSSLMLLSSGFVGLGAVLKRRRMIRT